MITYKLAEHVPYTKEYASLYFREDGTFLIGEVYFTLNKEGYYSYKTLDFALAELSNVVHDNIKSLKTIGCPIDDITEFAKDYVILECECPDEAVITVDGEIVRSQLIKPIKQLIHLTLEESL